MKIDEQNSIIDSLFVKKDSKGAPSQAKEEPKEIFFLKKFSPAKVFFKETKKHCTVLIYDDFVAFENKESGEKIFADLKNVDEYFRKIVKESNIKDFHFHDLRHTFASWLAIKGISLNTIKELLGHKSITMTQRYAHLSPDSRQNAVEQIHI